MVTSILDINITSNKTDIKRIIDKEEKGVMATINANILYNAYKNKIYKNLLQNNTINICDGSLVASLFNLISKKKIISYSGPDFFIDYIKETKYKHAFIGTTSKVLKGLSTNLSKYNSSIKDSLFLPVPFKSVEEFDYFEISKKINEVNPDFIWVSLGAPKQELFSCELFKYINSGFIVPVGAAFDFYSNDGESNRCPLFLRKLKLEWLFRLFMQPKKTSKRLIMEIVFMPIIFLKEIFNKIKK